VTSPFPLDYRGRHRRFRRNARRVCILALIAILGVVGYRYVEANRMWWQRRYWVWQCLHYVGPKDQFAGSELDSWSNLLTMGQRETITVFSHERISSGGLRRLVVVDAQIHDTPLPTPPRYHKPTPVCSLDVTFWAWDPSVLQRIDSKRLPAFWDSDTERLDIGDGSKIYTIGSGEQLHLLNGIPDPSDSSHFSFQYDLDGSRGTIDGWLRDDGSIKMSLRDGPATQEYQQENDGQYSEGRKRDGH
jgi:hypothetical protein